MVLPGAALFAWQALDLPMGTAVRMGPGYFPLVLGILLAILGAGVILGSLVVETDVPEGRLHKIKLEGPCEIVLDAYPSRRMRGRAIRPLRC